MRGRVLKPIRRGERPAKAALAPDLRGLDDRSVRAWTEPMAVVALGGGRYEVEGASDTVYRVDLPGGRCSCPDHRIRKVGCKHLRRVAIMITRGELPPPGRLAAVCRVCGRERYLPESGPELCDDCHPAPGTFATDRETGDTVVVAGLVGGRADETVLGDGRTVAEYPTNEGYPSDDPVVEVVYPFSAGSRGTDPTELRRYSFPLSRLELREERLVGREWD